MDKGKIYLRISAFRRVKWGSELQKRLYPVLLGFNLLYLAIIYTVCVRVWLFKGVRSYLRKSVFSVCWWGVSCAGEGWILDAAPSGLGF